MTLVGISGIQCTIIHVYIFQIFIRYFVKWCRVLRAKKLETIIFFSYDIIYAGLNIFYDITQSIKTAHVTPSDHKDNSKIREYKRHH